MSETFYIKKTAFDDASVDLVQRDNDSFVIGPGELNGPAGVNRDSDLELYGFGAIKWGEGVNQNQYRLMESNACPEKEAGDFLVGTDDPVGFVPGSGSFVPNAGSPINGAVPKDEYDLGIGNGITSPLIGQIWYNSTQEILYNYELSGWTIVYREVADSLTNHINDYTLHLTTLQNTFLDALHLPSLTADEVNTLDGISLSLGGGTVQGQLDLMVEKAGDTMSGDLSLDSGVALLFEAGEHRITNNDGGGNFNIRIGHAWQAGSPTGQEVYTGTDSGAIHLLGSHEGTAPNFTIKLGDTDTTTIGAPVTFSGSFNFTNDGNVSVNGTVPTDDDHLTRKDHVENFLDRRDDATMAAGKSINFSAGGEVRGLPLTPNTDTDAASKYYVDSASQAARIATYSSVGVHYFTIPAGVNMLFVSGAGAGQGGQGGGDGPTGTKPIPPQPNNTYVSVSTTLIRFKGGYSQFGVLSDEPRVTINYRDILNLAAMTPGLPPSTNCTNGDNCEGGAGGDSPWGDGGYPGNPVGGHGGTGAGGGGGYAQDFNEGQNFGWGGAGGGFAFGIPVPVSPGQTVTIRVRDGTAGSVGGAGRNGGDGGHGYIILHW